MEVEIKTSQLYKQKMCILATYLNSDYNTIRNAMCEAIGNYINTHYDECTEVVIEDLKRMHIMLKSK